MGNYSIALTGLQAQTEALNVVSENLANLNTAGFKSSSAEFQDLVSQALDSTTPNGAGVSPAMASRNFTQGTTQITSGAFDAAIEGNGFFITQNSQGQQLYTRSGNFNVDANNKLVTSNGDLVLGWTATNGTVNASGVPGAIVVPTGSIIAPTASTQFTLGANLNSSAAADATSSFSQPVTVIDSLGAKHTLNVTFTKTAANSWSYEVDIPGEDLSSGKAGTPSSLAKGTLTFGSDGQLTSPAPPSGTPPTGGTVAISVAGLADGAKDLSLNWNLYNPDNTSAITQYAQASSASGNKVDGNAAAELTQVKLSDGGMVTAVFSDGSQQSIGQLALAGIANPDSLIDVGNNEFSLSSTSSTPVIGTAGTGGRGQVKAGALEGSNVDIATEFTNLMTFQRSYQANSKAITTLDQMAQDLMQMKQ